MMKSATHLIVLVCFLGWPFAGYAEDEKAEVFLETHRSEFQKIPIWIMGFSGSENPLKDDTGIGKQVDTILRADLRRTHVFKVMKRATDTPPLSKAGCQAKASIAKAKASAAPLITWGRVGRKDGRLLMEACAYDGGETDVIAVGKLFNGDPPITKRLLRSLVHRWADTLVAHYAGDPGIAQTAIMYVSADKGGRKHIYQMDYDGFGPRRVTSDPILSLMPAWSPDRRALVYTTYHNNNQNNNQKIVRLELGKRLSQGNKRILVPPSQTLNLTPAISPNGRLLAYASAKKFTKKSSTDIFMMDLSTGKKTRLTKWASAELSPTWSPDGRELAFTSDQTGRPQIYIMKIDSKKIRRLTFEGRENAAPAWSPRGDWIAYVCSLPGYGYKLCRISVDGERRVQITRGRSSEIDDSPSWAPDGRHLVFSSTRGGRSHIFMIQDDGTGLEQLTKGGIHHSSPAWSPLSE